MSRIGKQPISIPNGVEVTIEDKNISIKGPKGELSLHIPHGSKRVVVEKEGNEIKISVPKGKEAQKAFNAYHGLYRSLINNMVVGVSEGYKRELEMKGIGYRAAVEGETLVLNVGFSHQVKINKIEGIKFTVNENTNILVEGIYKQMVGQVAANIRKVRPPEPYKGKGIRYKDEIVKRKAGKSAKAAAK